ncbi:hypothetical protein L596_001555 [Steinernema carpocapsae]|uniref:Uncharacterized protein n=1 Tax=Steinernema carpocapsae TaxID=34508 RepID=A0A4U8UNK9_STECR|nr:hypothetical protein L596_001555 [Steinernema carpocapsae]
MKVKFERLTMDPRHRKRTVKREKLSGNLQTVACLRRDPTTRARNAPCAIHNHRRKGHYLVALTEDDREHLKKLSMVKELMRIVKEVLSTLQDQGMNVNGVFVKPEADAELEKLAEPANES